jgi:hypothetical protein
MEATRSLPLCLGRADRACPGVLPGDEHSDKEAEEKDQPQGDGGHGDGDDDLLGYG